MSGTEDFNWKGTEGDAFAAHNLYTAEDVDNENVEFFGITCTDMLKKSLEALFAAGLDKKTAKVLDIGCGTGGKLAILEQMGFTPSNLYGIELNAKAVVTCNKAHPEFHVKEINGFDYSVHGVESFDLVYHSDVFCHITPDDYRKFFANLKSLKPKFYMFIEGINPKGYEKMPNGAGKGFMYTNDVPKVVKEMLPEAEEISNDKIDFLKHIHEEWFKPIHMDYTLIVVYKMGA